jgi:DNA-directed RNA polymerase subunit RPC12/RpoP
MIPGERRYIPRERVRLPRGWEVKTADNSLVLEITPRRDHFRRNAIILFFVGIGCLGVSAAFLSDKAYVPVGIAGLMALVMFYGSVKFFLDSVRSTTVTVQAGSLAVLDRWPWWKREGRMGALDIRQFWVTREEVSRQEVMGKTTRIDYIHRIRARSSAGREWTVLDTIPRPEQALFVEQQLEEFLGIADVPDSDAVDSGLALGEEEVDAPTEDPAAPSMRYLACPNCGKAVQASDSGSRSRCTACGSEFSEEMEIWSDLPCSQCGAPLPRVQPDAPSDLVRCVKCKSVERMDLHARET